jgi:hypothetical protein
MMRGGGGRGWKEGGVGHCVELPNIATKKFLMNAIESSILVTSDLDSYK